MPFELVSPQRWFAFALPARHLRNQMDLGQLKLMREASELLDAQLKSLGRVILRSGGRVSMTDAKAHAEREYTKFTAERKRLRHEQADQAIAEKGNWPA